MSTFKTNVRLKDAGIQDYERLDREMTTQAFVRSGGTLTSAEPIQGREYQYRGPGSLQEVTAATYRAAYNTGKQYSFTIIRQKPLAQTA